MIQLHRGSPMANVMSGVSEYQNVFRVERRQTAKRNRQPVSCSACRKRKLKCDRQAPCMSCTARGIAESCNFPTGVKKRRDGHEEGSRASEAQLRLQKLEDMVTSLMQTTKGGLERRGERTHPESSVCDQHTEMLPSPQVSEHGRLDIVGSETKYLGATHWTTILENIRDIQGFLKPDNEDGEEIVTSTLPDSPDFILDSTRPLTMTDVCNSLPPRPVVDKILSYWFNAKYFQSPIIHNAKFLREYESFWADPSSVSFLWVSILFSLLFIGSQISQASAQEVLHPSEAAVRATFFTKASQALIAGKYRMARPYSVEALLLYALCNYLSKKEDPDTDAWMIAGISVRLAMRMGYHRDPSHLPGISPFEGEMRRRTWCIVRTFELLLSFQCGIPAIVHEEECDTELPGNLFDEDFDEDCKVVPVSRPPTDPTPMLYWCYKARVAKVFRRVTQYALSLSTRSYDDLMKLDAEIHETHAKCPPSLRIKPLSASFTDQIHTILFRLNIDLLYQKSLCVLHRNTPSQLCPGQKEQLTQQGLEPMFAYARKVCADAALAILKHQAELHFASQPGGQLFAERWMLSSLTQHDFLLASMITCRGLYEAQKAENTADLAIQLENYDALKLSHEIFISRAEISRDARRASKILSAMLSKVPRPSIQRDSVDVQQERSRSVQAKGNGTAAMETSGVTLNPSTGPLWDTNTFDLPAHDFEMNASVNSDSADPLSSMFGFDTIIDWGLVDQYLSGSGDAVNLQ